MLKGVICSLGASMLFGFMYYFSTQLIPLTGQEIFAFRIILALPFVLGAIFILKQKYRLTALFRRIYAQPRLFFILVITASITGFEMWLFLWAPTHNEALNVSIGYLILPLVMVVVGRVFFKEKISRLKLLAISSAGIGVGIDVFFKGGGSWASVAVCAYAFYFLLRKYFNLMDLASLLMEFLILLPISCYFASQTDFNAIRLINPAIVERLFILGLAGGVAFTLYILASNLLPINMLGLLGYAEPILLLFTSILIGEKITPDSYPLFFGLIFSILFITWDSLRENKKPPKSMK